LSFKVGEIVADYEITGVLGTGGMSTVYQVRHLISDRIEAMKVLLPNLEENPDLAERFVREIRLLASLSHPGIAMLHTAIRERNQLLMVMELVLGDTVETLLRRRGIELSSALNVTIQILDALAYAHNRGVIHRDIKPSNIMLAPSGQAKLLDFGIARPVADIQLTQKGATLGSYHYMSPEQIRGLPVDRRTDLYSLGVTLYEMVTGTRPFTGSDPYTIMRSQVEQAPPPPESINGRIPPELSGALRHVLMKDPAKRFQTAGEFSESLNAIRVPAGAGPESASYNRAPQTPTPSRSVLLRPAATAFDPAALERLTLALAEHIGPIAGVLVLRAAKTATSWDNLCQALAGELPERERGGFLSSCHG